MFNVSEELKIWVVLQVQLDLVSEQGLVIICYFVVLILLPVVKLLELLLLLLLLPYQLVPERVKLHFLVNRIVQDLRFTLLGCMLRELEPAVLVPALGW